MAFDPTWVRQVERWRRFLAEKQVTQPQPLPGWQAGMPQAPGYAYRPPVQGPVTIDPRRLPVWLGGGPFAGAQPQTQYQPPGQPLDVGALPPMPPGGLEQTIEGFQMPPGIGEEVAAQVLPLWMREPEQAGVPQWLMEPAKMMGYIYKRGVSRVGASLAQPGVRGEVTPPIEPEEYTPEWWKTLERAEAEKGAANLEAFRQASREYALATPRAGKFWERLTQTYRAPRSIEEAAGVFWQLLQESANALTTIGGTGIMLPHADKYGLEMEEWLPLADRAYSLMWEQVLGARERSLAIIHGKGEYAGMPLGERLRMWPGQVLRAPEEDDVFAQVLGQIATGKATAEELALAHEHLGAELLGRCAGDPLNFMEAVDVALRVARAKHLTTAQARVATTIVDNPKALKALTKLADDFARVGADEAEMLRLATEAKGIKTPARVWNQIKEVFGKPFELVPEAKVIRDLGDTWIVLAGPMAIPKSGDEALDLLRMWVDEPEALRPFFGALVDSPAGRKAAIILEHTMDEIKTLPSLKAELFDPRMLMAEMDPVMHNALRQAHGWKELGRVEQFFHGYKALISEFYLTGLYSPGYMFRNFGSDFTGMALDGLATFEKSSNIDRYFDDLAAAFMPRRIETKGTGLREAFTGIPEGESKLPGVFGAISRKGQELVQHAEPFGRLPLGEEPRYRRAFYKGIKTFFDQNAPGMTPALPEAVARFFGPRADDLHQAVSRAVSMQAKRKILDDFLGGASKGAMIDPARYIDPDLLDAVSPEMMGRVRERLGTLTAESTKEEVVAAFDELRDVVDQDELERMAELEILPEIQGSPDVREVEIADEMVDKLEEAIQKAKDDPQLVDDLTRELEEVKRRIPEVEEELTTTRQGAIDELLTEPQEDGLEILMVAYRDTADLQDESRKIMNRLLRETRAVAQSNPAAKSQAWGEYFRNARKEWENLAKARAARMTEAQAQLRRLQAGESLDEILGARAAIDEHVEMLRRASEVLPEPEKGWLPGRVTEDADRFDRFLAWQRANFDRARAKAWRAVYGAEGDNYGPILDLLNSAETDIERYGKATAGRVKLLREKAFADSQAAFRKHKDPKYARWAADAVWEKYYIQRNDAWSKFWKASEQRWKLTERDILIDNYHKGPRMAPPQPLEVAPEAVAAEIQPGDVELVKSAAPKPDADWTPEERAAVERWTGAGRSVPEPVQEVLPTPKAAGVPAYSRDRFYQDLMDTFGASEEEADGVLALWDAVAEQWGLKTGRQPQEFFAEYLAGFRRGEAPPAGAMYLQPGTPKFNAWFKQSRVVDEAGKPRQVYHGTMAPEDFAEFSVSGPPIDERWGLERVSTSGDPTAYMGAHFAEEPEVAAKFAGMEGRADWLASRYVEEGEAGGRVYPAYLSIQNHKEFASEQELRDFIYEMDMSSSHEVDAYAQFADDWDYEEFFERYETDPAFRYDIHQNILEDALRGEDPGAFASELGNEATRQLEAQGFDGVRYRNDVEGGASWIAFEPQQIKSPWNLRPTEDPRLLYQTAEDWAPRWWYKAEQVITDKMPNNASVEQVRNILTKGGIKQDELQWNNVLDWLDTQEGMVSKDDVLTHLMENRVQVEEVVKGAHTFSVEDSRRFHELDTLGRPLTMGENAEWQELNWRFRQAQQGIDRGSTAKYQQYTLPGGEEYRELLLTLPVSVTDKRAYTDIDVMRWHDISPEVWNNATDVERGQMLAEFEQFNPGRVHAEDVGVPKVYRGSHWEEPNVLAHVRFNERTGPNGERILFIEEIQSDWHQAGRELRQAEIERLAKARGIKRDTPEWKVLQKEVPQDFGYQRKVTELPQGYTTEQINLAEKGQVPALNWYVRDPSGNLITYGIHRHEKGAVAEALLRVSERGVPPAPFIQSWDELTLKRMMRWAAENDFDSIAWTTGAQQADRYDLAKYVDTIYYDEKSGWFAALKDDEQLIGRTINKDELAEYVGKERVQALLDSRPEPGRPHVHRLEGEGLQVGGQGMAGFYDRILPYSSNKLTKRWGVQVGDLVVGDAERLQILSRAEFDAISGGRYADAFAEDARFVVRGLDDPMEPLAYFMYEDQAERYVEKYGRVFNAHGLRITPQMKRDLLTEGLPLFQHRKGAAQFLDDGRAIIHAFESADFTTVIHETGHVFLNALGDMDPDGLALYKNWALSEADRLNGLAQEGKLSERLRARLFVDEAGNPAEQLKPIRGDGSLTRAGHELWASSFERYMAEGSAPSPQLQGVFDRFKEWILSIYRALTGSEIDVKISDTVRGVMDRMIAESPPVRPGDWRGAEISAVRQEQQIAPFRQAMQKAKNRHPLSLQDASQMFSMDPADPRLGDHLADIAQKHELKSTTEHLRAEAWKQAHHKLEEPKYIEIGGYTRELKYERTLTAEKQRQLYWELQGVSPPKKVKGKIDRADLARAQREAKAFRQENKDISDWYYSLAMENLKRQRGEEVAAAVPPEWIAQDAIEAVEEMERLGGRQTVEDMLAQAGRGPLFQAAEEEPRQVGMFEETMEDLPLWSGTAPRAPGARYAPPTAGAQGMLPGMELEIGEQAKYAARPAGEVKRAGQMSFEEFKDAAQWLRREGGRKLSIGVGPSQYNLDMWVPGAEKNGKLLMEPDEVLRRLHERLLQDEAKRAQQLGFMPGEELRPKKIPKGQQTLWQEAEGLDRWEVQELETAAARIFGTTYDPREAGFILQDGTLIDFSGKKVGGTPGRRAFDHRDISQAFEEAGQVLPERLMGEATDTLQYFMDQTGAMRISVFDDWFSIDVAAMPSQEQRAFVNRLLRQGLEGGYSVETGARFLGNGQLDSALDANKLWRDLPDMLSGNTLYQNAPPGQAGFWDVNPAGWQEYRAAMNQPGAVNTPLPQNLLDVSNQATRKALDQMQTGIADDWDNWQPRLASRDIRQQATNWLNSEVTPNWYESLATGLDYGRQQADFALLDYSKRRNLDLWAGYIFPYHYWFTRAGANWARRLAARPGLVASYMRVRDAMRQANENAGRRQRFGDKVRIPFPWLPDWMGGNLYVDPVGLFLPLADMLYSDSNDPDEGARGLQKIFKEWRRYGLRPYHFWDYLYQSGKFAKAGEMLGMAPGEAQQMLGPEIQGDYGTMFPQTRLLQTLTAAGRQVAPEALSFIPPGGFNLEAPLRRGLGLQAGEVWDPYRINRMLGNLAAEDPQNRELARTALMAQELVARDETQAGKVWDPSSPLAQQVAQEMNWSPEELGQAQQLLTLAMQRATLERGMGSLGWLAGPSVSIEPAGERAQLEMAEQARQQGWSPTQPEGSRAQYQQFKEQYPAMYPRATQYATIPGAQEGATMPAGARANWMAAKQQKAQINAQFDQAVDDLLRAQPWNTAGRRELENQRYAMLDQIDEQFPVSGTAGELPAILYGMNPAEMWDSSVEKEIRQFQQTKPDPDAFTRAGEVDWSAYYNAVDKWQAGLPQQFSFGDVQGGTYQGMGPKEAVTGYEQRYDSPIEAAVKVYQDVIASPAWDSYHSTEDYPGTVGKVGPVYALSLIPAILAQYRTKGWTPQQLQQELQGVVFPALSDQQALRKGEEPGQVYATGQGQGRSAYTNKGSDWWNNKDIYNETAQRVQKEGWRAVYGLPWWEKYRRGGGGGGGGKKRYSTYGAYYSSGGRWSPYGGRWRPPYPVRGGPFQF